MATTEEQPSEKKLINLLRGWPSPHLLPAALLKTAADAALTDPAVFVPALQYGPDPGYQPLREALATWLGTAYNVDPDPERICVTGGASQNIACILQSFTDPAYTRAVWVVAPCYFLACPIFEDAGFKGRLRAVPEDAEGIDLAALERGMVGCEGGVERPIYKDPRPLRKIYRHVVYVVPTCANPSGKTMSLRRREGLVRLARDHDALVICDDVYDFLQWPTSPTSPPTSSQIPIPLLPRLSDIDYSLGPSAHDRGGGGAHFGHAVSNGSFSKLVGPGVRTGWAVGTRAFALGLSQTGATRSGGAPSQLVAAMMAQAMRGPGGTTTPSGGGGGGGGMLDEHVREKVRPALRRRWERAVRAVKEELCFSYRLRLRQDGGSDGVEGEEEEVKASVAVRETSEGEGEGKMGVYGGYFLWLTLPGWEGPSVEMGGEEKKKLRLEARKVAERALAEENLVIAPGNIFEVAGDEAAVQFSGNIRLCFSWEDEDAVVEGIERLGRVLRRMWEEKLSGDSSEELSVQGASGEAGEFK